MPIDPDDDDDETAGPSRRIPKVLVRRESLPSVENALDDFIVRAKQQPVDVSEFSADAREAQLRRQIEELEHKLADAEARASEPARGGAHWGAITLAFVVGCAGMFAVNHVTRSEPAARSSSSTAAAPAATAPAPSLSAQPPAVAVEPAAVPAAVPAPVEAPMPAPVPAPVEEPRPPPITAPATSPAPAAKARPQPSGPKDKPAGTPPASGSGDLYDPFGS